MEVSLEEDEIMKVLLKHISLFLQMKGQNIWGKRVFGGGNQRTV